MALVMVSVRGMPWGIGLFLVYALLILAGVGLSLGYVVDLALEVPITPLGLVVMALLAYTIFTITLVLQRKEAARGLTVGLTSLAVPAVPLALFVGPPLGFVAAILIGTFALVLYRALRSPAAKEWLNQP